MIQKGKSSISKNGGDKGVMKSKSRSVSGATRERPTGRSKPSEQTGERLGHPEGVKGGKEHGVSF